MMHESPLYRLFFSFFTQLANNHFVQELLLSPSCDFSIKLYLWLQYDPQHVSIHFLVPQPPTPHCTMIQNET